MVAEPIRIQGLKEFGRNLKKIDSELPKAVRLALNQAADLVVSDARPRVPKRSGKAARSLKAKSTRTAVRVQGGGARAPYYPWLDFGGRVGRGRSIVRPFLKEGRFIYASFFDLRQSGSFQEVMTNSLLDVVRQAGVDIDA